MPIAKRMSDPVVSGSHVFYRNLRRRLPRIVRGEGCYLFDDTGRRYLDACGGAFTANVGHGVAEIADAVGAQARTLGYVNGTAFTHDPVEELAAEIARLSPGDLELVYPLGSGSEAMVGLRMAEVLKGTRVVVIPTDGPNGFNPLDLKTVLKRFDVRE